MQLKNSTYASRAGQKLEFALDQFGIDVNEKICADLGCSTGGFTDCLLRRGAGKIYSVDTGYGVLDYKLRIDPRVVVFERQNAMHVTLSEPVDFISIDVGWTPQKLIFPHAASLLKPQGQIISLLKPHYEAKNPHLSQQEAFEIAQKTVSELRAMHYAISAILESPIVGEKGGNHEYLICYTQS